MVSSIVWGACFVAEAADDGHATFEERYRAWVEYTETQDSLSSAAGINPALESIIDLGPAILPFLIEKMEKKAYKLDFQLGFAVFRLSKKQFGKDEYPEVRDSITEAQAYVKWWREERKRTPEIFARLFKQWKSYRDTNQTEQAESQSKNIRDLGIDALPLILNKIETGENDLIPVVAWITSDGVAKAASREQCVSWWAANKEKWTLPPSEK